MLSFISPVKNYLFLRKGGKGQQYKYKQSNKINFSHKAVPPKLDKPAPNKFSKYLKYKISNCEIRISGISVLMV